MTDQFTMPGHTLDILGQALGVSVRQYPLALPHLGGDGVELVHAIEDAYTDLVDSGLADTEQLNPEVEQAVLLLGRAPLSVGVLADDSQGRWLARAALGDDGAVLVEQVGELVEFTLLSGDDWHDRLAAMLPSMRPARGDEVVTTRNVGEQQEEADLSREPLLRSARPSGGTTMDDVEEVFAASRTGSGHFAVTGTDRLGKPVQAPALSWIDSELGAYAVTSRTARGQERVTFTPVDNAALGRLLHERVESVRL